MSNTIIEQPSADWTSENPVLALNTIGLETDTDKKKVGDGTTAWNGLPYVSGGPISVVNNAVGVVNNSTTIAASPPYEAVGTEGRWFNVNDGNTYIDINDGTSSQWVLENPPIIVDYGIDDLVTTANEAVAQTQQDTSNAIDQMQLDASEAIQEVNDALDNLTTYNLSYYPLSSGQMSINRNYFILATTTYTLPNTTGLTNGNVVAMIKVQGTTPIYQVDGSNNEKITHETSSGTETDTTATHIADAEIKFMFNNGNWEV